MTKAIARCRRLASSGLFFLALLAGDGLLASDEDLIAKAEVDNPTPFVGEQVILTHKVLTRRQIYGLDIEKAPDLNNFLVESLWISEKPQVQIINLNGKVYQELVVKQTALYPLIAKESRIPPITFAVNIDSANKRTLYLETNDLKIFPKPLPSANRPANFSGAVGDYRLSLTLDKNRVRVGEVLNAMLKIEGRGQINGLTPPPIESTAQLKVLSARLASSRVGLDTSRMRSMKNSEYVGEKVWNIRLVPKVAGSLVLKPISFSYFDPKTERYAVVRTKEAPVHAVKGGSSDREIEEPGGYVQHAHLMRFLIWAFSILTLTGGVIFLRRRRRAKGALRSSPDAVIVLRRHLDEAKTVLPNRNSKKFFDLIAKGIRAYIQARFHIALRASKADEMREALTRGGLPVEEAEKIAKILERCDFGRFTTAPLPAALREEIYRDAMQIAEAR